MDGLEVSMLQRAADIMRTDFGDLTPEAIAAFLFLMTKRQTTIQQLGTALAMLPAIATRAAIELSQHQNGPDLVNMALDGDINRVMILSEKGEMFASRLGYVLKS